MSKLALSFVAMTALLTVLAASRTTARAASTPEQRCLASKLTATSRLAAADLGCRSKAAGKGLTPAAACLAKAKENFNKAWDRAESKPSCPVDPSQKAAVLAAVDAFEQALIVALPDLDVSGADIQRGGLLYDRWWIVNGAPTPAGTFPLYTTTAGTQTGSGTWRCKECHGWDYKGKDGAYASESHYSGVDGVLNQVAGLTNREIFNAIKNPAPGGHDFSAQISDADIRNLVRFLREGLLDMDVAIDPITKAAKGDAPNGLALFAAGGAGACASCHGLDGTAIDFGGGEYVGTVASDNPWEGLHKIRWGQPGAGMPSAVNNGLTLGEQTDILTHAQTLPQ